MKLGEYNHLDLDNPVRISGVEVPMPLVVKCVMNQNYGVSRFLSLLITQLRQNNDGRWNADLADRLAKAVNGSVCLFVNDDQQVARQGETVSRPGVRRNAKEEHDAQRDR